MCSSHEAISTDQQQNLRLQGYNFEVVHTEGSQNPLDFLSRHSSLNADDKQDTLTEEYVNFLASAAVPNAMILAEIQETTAQDITMQANLIRTQSSRNMEKLPKRVGDVDCAELNWFKQVRHELTVNHETNVILQDSRIVVPAALCDRAVSIAHESHQGLVETKQLFRENIWFPGIDDTVHRMIKKCIACQANDPSNHLDLL